MIHEIGHVNIFGGSQKVIQHTSTILMQTGLHAMSEAICFHLHFAISFNQTI